MPLALLRSSHERLAREGFGFANVVPGQSRVRHRVVDVAGENVIAQLAIDAQPLLQGRHSILCGAGVKERRAEIQVRRAQLPAQAELPAYGDRFLERIQRFRVASLNHCDHASDRQSVAEVHWVCALARQLQTLGTKGGHSCVIALRKSQSPGRPHGLGAKRDWRLAGHRKRSIGPTTALRELTHLPPVTPQRNDVSERQDCIAAVDCPGHAAPHVRPLEIKTPEPDLVSRPHQVRLGVLRQSEVVERVPPPDFLALARLEESPGRVLLDDVEHAVARFGMVAIE